MTFFGRYNIDSTRRYPLPETAPCTTHCRLSPDARWITYFNDPTNAFNRGSVGLAISTGPDRREAN